MKNREIKDTPKVYAKLEEKCKEIGFTMPSDIWIGTLLKTLIASKPKGQFLELGTGMSLSLAWMIDGMDTDSKITSIDNDPTLIKVAIEFFGDNKQVELVCEDGAIWIDKNINKKFDLIFADAWPGKYGQIEEVLTMVEVGGFYVIDDMTAQPNWPEGHQEYVNDLISYLDKREDYSLAKMDWSTGVIIATRKY